MTGPAQPDPSQSGSAQSASSHAELWVHLPSGQAFEVPHDHTWPATGQDQVMGLGGATRPVLLAELGAWQLPPGDALTRLLGDETLREGLLSAVHQATPPEGQWLTQAAQAPTAQAFVDAAGGAPEAAARFSGLLGVIQALERQGGPARLGEWAAQAVRQSRPDRNSENATAPVPELALPPALLCLEAVTRRAVQVLGPQATQRVATQARTTSPAPQWARPSLTVSGPPSLSYAELLGRPLTPPEPDKEGA